MSLKSHGRFDYHGLPGRGVYDWPNGTRLCVYLGLSEGVVAVFGRADLGALGEASVNPLVPNLRLPPFNLLADGKVDAVGQPVAAIVAWSPAEARDALALVELDIGEAEGRRGGSQDEAFSQAWRSGDVDASFAAAAHIAKVRVTHARVAPMALEPRAALAAWDDERQELRAWFAPVIRAEIWSCIEELKAIGQSILVIDKNLNVLRRLADRHVVLEKGRTVWSGTSADMDRDMETVHAYVGV